MATYNDINALLLNTNKGRAGASSPELPVPGDGVVVSVVDRGLINILVHHVDPKSLGCRGETTAHVLDGRGHEILSRAEYVVFDYQKIAGIHRR